MRHVTVHHKTYDHTPSETAFSNTDPPNPHVIGLTFPEKGKNEATGPPRDLFGSKC